MKSNLLIVVVLVVSYLSSTAQETFPVNGAHDEREHYYFLTNAILHINANETVQDASMIIRQGQIIEIGTDLTSPEGAITKDLTGLHVYPSFIDLSTTYGIPEAELKGPRPRNQEFESGKKGAFSWNESLIPEYEASIEFHHDEKAAAEYRRIGFGTVLTHRDNGIVQGSGLLTTLQNEKPHLTILNPRASSHLSFSKAKTYQSPPSSLMGIIALIRQFYLDVEWYELTGKKEVTNLSLASWDRLKDLPQFFTVSDKLDVLRAARIAKEYNKIYIIRGGGDEYQRAEAIAQTGMPLIIPIQFPKPYDVEDPLDADIVTLEQMKHWEWAPKNLAVLARHGIPFAITSDLLEDKKQFLDQIRKAISYGLDEEEALKALTTRPAQWIGESGRLGQLKEGYLANFLITDKPIFEQGAHILENWVQGVPDVIQKPPSPLAGNQYLLDLDQQQYKISIDQKGEKLTLKTTDSSTINGTASEELDRTILMFRGKNGYYYQLTGKQHANGDISGTYKDANGEPRNFRARYIEAKKPEKKSDKDSLEVNSELTFPFSAYGRKDLPEQKTYVIRNATVWTNTDQGIRSNTDVLIRDGKIARVGQVKAMPNAVIIDANGMHLTPGIIDEHSHIAISRGVNEGTLASSAAVRIGDVLNSEDINIYRQLAGGVTTSQILHGSANPIGGQSALIKLRWGADPEGLKFEGADPFIKFALGENVKQSNWGPENTVRFPQTRMGVEQVYEDHFTRAREYGELKQSGKPYRKDLELETLLEILEGERFITCHSYVQSEINMLMHLAERYGFQVNTFTHILEGYKVADKMAEHGAAGSTFSDWWAYKYEVIDAIPYNATLMHDAGVLTALNSDDAEMARRLNTEAGKTIKYGGLTEEEALKLVTLNPAKMLHIDDQVGRIQRGMDADVVLWNDHPLSIFASAQKTFIDGRIYFDRESNEQKEKEIVKERQRLIQEMIRAKKGGAPTQKAVQQKDIEYHCDSIDY